MLTIEAVQQAVANDAIAGEGGERCELVWVKVVMIHYSQIDNDFGGSGRIEIFALPKEGQLAALCKQRADRFPGYLIDYSWEFYPSEKGKPDEF